MDGQCPFSRKMSRPRNEIVNRLVPSNRFSVSALVPVRRRPSLAEEAGEVMIVPSRPVYVDEPMEFVYAVQRPHAQLEYRLDFGDGQRWSTVESVNSTIHLPRWLNNSNRKSSFHFRELVYTVSENRNINAQLSDPDTRIACLFARCRCGAACV